MSFTLNRDTTGVPVAAFDADKDIIKIGNNRKAFRDDFPGSSLDVATNWTVIQTGAGMTITVANGILTITTGTTINSESIIKSQQAYRLPSLLLAIVNLSQRIVNQEFYIELTNADGSNKCGWYLENTTATQGKLFNKNVSVQKTSSAQTIVTTASDAILEIEAFRDKIQFHSRTLNAARANSYVFHQNVPDPNDVYYVQIRAKNLGSAPASTTTFNIDVINVLDISDIALSTLALI